MKQSIPIFNNLIPIVTINDKLFNSPSESESKHCGLLYKILKCAAFITLDRSCYVQYPFLDVWISYVNTLYMILLIWTLPSSTSETMFTPFRMQYDPIIPEQKMRNAGMQCWFRRFDAMKVNAIIPRN